MLWIFETKKAVQLKLSLVTTSLSNKGSRHHRHCLLNGTQHHPVGSSIHFPTLFAPGPVAHLVGAYVGLV